MQCKTGSRSYSDKQLVLRKKVHLICRKTLLLNYRLRTRTTSRPAQGIFVSRITVRQCEPRNAHLNKSFYGTCALHTA